MLRGLGIRTAVFHIMLIGVIAHSGPANACGSVVKIVYEEDAPDFFRIEFLDGDGYELTALALDLSTSVGRAYIDTPYPSSPPATASALRLTAADGFAHGSQRMAFRFENFRPKLAYSLLVDLDNSAGWDSDHLLDGEIKGATVSVRLTGADNTSFTVDGAFDEKGVAELGSRACA